MHPTEKNKIVVDEEAAPIVRRIFYMALEGISCGKITSALNEEQIPAPANLCSDTAGLFGREYEHFLQTEQQTPVTHNDRNDSA